MEQLKTRGGIRLSQHGVVISELRSAPGPTHSVWDVLAALIALFEPSGRVAVLGFSGGGMMAPLRRLGHDGAIDAVDLDAKSHRLFREHCGAWSGTVRWNHGDAGEWLRAQPRGFSMIVDDLSMPADGDVIKPELCWKSLPRLIRDRLAANGVAVFNLLPRADNTWPPELDALAGLFASHVTVEFEGFENRVLVAGDAIPGARVVGARLRGALRALGSRQAGRVRVRSRLPFTGGHPVLVVAKRARTR